MRIAAGSSHRIDRRWFVLTIALSVGLSLAVAASGHHRLSREDCRRLNEQMEKLQSRLRQGHSGAQARRYREKMRELQLRRFRKC
jgi:hypothetical protein